MRTAILLFAILLSEAIITSGMLGRPGLKVDKDQSNAKSSLLVFFIVMFFIMDMFELMAK